MGVRYLRNSPRGLPSDPGPSRKETCVTGFFESVESGELGSYPQIAPRYLSRSDEARQESRERAKVQDVARSQYPREGRLKVAIPELCSWHWGCLIPTLRHYIIAKPIKLNYTSSLPLSASSKLSL